MTAPLRLTDVTLRLGEGDAQVMALDGVSLSARAGELLAVVGPSGSGKSSLLAVAGGLLRPSAGEISIGGQALHALRDREVTALRRRRVGYVFQTSNLLPALTARDQLLLVAHLNRALDRAAHRRADELLHAVGMTDRAGHRPHQLSGGERQRVGIARALMGEPDVLLVDEPTSALDRARAAEVVDLLARQAHARETAAVMVTHDTGVLDTADRTVALRDGRLAAA
jgi:putative ABC transport system ATP-binding protein